jgi:UDP-glucose 4-epimerase
MLTGQQVVINGDGEQERDFVYVGDCAQANRIAVQSQASSGIYNLGCGQGTTVNQVYRVLKEITGYGLEAQHAPPKLGETRRIFLNAHKARVDLGWKPIVELQQGMEKTVAYFRSVEMAL